MTSALAADLGTADIENVFIYVADAVRWDTLSRTIAERGTVEKTVAASIHSPSSFASVVTGRDLPAHGVTDFDHQIPDSTFRLFDLDEAGYETRFLNTIGLAGGDDPLFPVLRCPRTDATDPFAGVTEPFVAMERSQGGHAPYGAFEGTAREYFRERGAVSIADLRSEYREGVERDAKAFTRRLNTLAERDLLDSTLVIYTSDHGELLGEGGLFGHNGPIRPEHVYVPTVFVHPEIGTRRSKRLFRHTDLLPTVLDVLNAKGSLSRPEQGSIGGHSVRSDPPPETGRTFYHLEHDLGALPIAPASRYESVWDASGGYVFARTPAHERLTGLLSSAAQGSQRSLVRCHLPAACMSYLGADWVYGVPGFSITDAQRTLAEANADGQTQSGTELNLTDDARQRLRDMGYLK